MTPLKKAQLKEKETKKRDFIIANNICPDCGGTLTIEYWGEFSPFYDYICYSCPPKLIERTSGFLFKTKSMVYVPKIIKTSC